jgi:radical SAM protein with 4Fe4S-binding SPASM domain
MSKKIFKKSEKIWLIMTGFSCNNDCVMCSTKPKSNHYSNRSSEEIEKDLIIGKKMNYERVEFTGGEPTIRPDILNLIKKAKNLKYREVAISTNGRMLSYDAFCKKAVENGLNRATFTLSAHNNKLGEAISRTPNAFKQTIEGIKNTVACSSVEVSVNTVPIKVNYTYLSEIGKLISSLGVEFWNILDLIPDGYGKDFYKILSVKMVNLSIAVNNLEKIVKNFKLVTFFDFPLCIFNQKFRNSSCTNFITARGRVGIEKQVGYKPERFKKSDKNFYEDIHKERIKICKNCKFSKICGGVWRDYTDLYGKREIELLAKKHNCIK